MLKLIESTYIVLKRFFYQYLDYLNANAGILKRLDPQHGIKINKSVCYGRWKIEKTTSQTGFKEKLSIFLVSMVESGNNAHCFEYLTISCIRIFVIRNIYCEKNHYYWSFFHNSASNTKQPLNS